MCFYAFYTVFRGLERKNRPLLRMMSNGHKVKNCDVAL